MGILAAPVDISRGYARVVVMAGLCVAALDEVGVAAMGHTRRVVREVMRCPSMVGGNRQYYDPQIVERVDRQLPDISSITIDSKGVGHVGG